MKTKPNPISFGNYLAFLTGSQVYGKPKPSSDIDLVVAVGGDTLDKLIELARKEQMEATGGTQTSPGPTAASFLFGRLNLIVVTTEEAFEVWRKGTVTLKEWKQRKGKPISREKAIKHFAKLREKLSTKESSPTSKKTKRKS